MMDLSEEQACSDQSDGDGENCLVFIHNSDSQSQNWQKYRFSMTEYNNMNHNLTSAAVLQKYKI